MDELILQALRGTIGTEDAKQLRAWRDESPANEQHYQDIARIWRATAPKLTMPQPDALTIIAAAERSFSLKCNADRFNARSSRTATLLKVAAILAAAVATGVAALRFVGGSEPTQYAADGNAPMTVTLPDGSFVRLAPSGSLRVEEMETTRSVHLDGRAFFAVKHDVREPFVVHTGGGSVTVLGTRFEVSGTDDGVRVIVRDGQVALGVKRDTAIVRAGQVGFAEAGRAPTVTAPANVDSLLDWPNGVLIFRDTRLSYVMEEVSSFFGRGVLVTDSSLLGVPVTAWFDGESFEDVVEAVCLITGLVCDPASRPVRISPAQALP